MLGNEIVTAAPEPGPRGVFLEGIIAGAYLPGTMMQIKLSVNPDATGRLTFSVYDTSADGEQRIPIVLVNVPELGQTPDTAYAANARGRVYIPAIGEVINVRVGAGGTGTGDAVAVGALFMIDDGTGVLIATSGSPESEPFQCVDPLSDVVSVAAGGSLVGCIFTGY